jgi:hypothetical protein
LQTGQNGRLWRQLDSWRHPKSSSKRTSIGSNVQDCLTGAAQKEQEKPTPRTTTESGNLTPTGRYGTGGGVPTFVGPGRGNDRIEEVEIEDIGSHTVSDRNSLAWDDDQDLQSEEPESTPDPIPAQGQEPEKQSPAKRAAQICKILMGTDYVRLILEFKGDIDDAKDRQLMHLAIAECKNKE